MARVRSAFGLPAGVTKHKYPLERQGFFGLDGPGALGTLRLKPAGGPAGSTVGVPGTWMEEKSIAGTSATGGCMGRVAAGLGAWMAWRQEQ